jgi:hypothetical protein
MIEHRFGWAINGAPGITSANGKRTSQRRGANGCLRAPGKQCVG